MQAQISAAGIDIVEFSQSFPAWNKVVAHVIVV
jgi:hypothetical protein